MRIPQRLGPYQLGEEIGRGGMAVVYRGHHVDTGTIVAVKTVHMPKGTHLARLRTEIHALRRIHHANIIRVLDAELDGPSPWYAMDLLTGRTLDVYITELWAGQALHRSDAARQGAPSTTITASHGAASTLRSRGDESKHHYCHDGSTVFTRNPAAQRFPAAAGHLSEVIGLVRRLCKPLAHLHLCGIVHRDLTPRNVFLCTDGQLVLMDFGLIARAGHSSGRDVLESAGDVLGTVAYMSPEQISGQLVDARADLYALGCIFYELLTGSVPFRATKDDSVMRMHLENAPTPLSEIVSGMPPEIESLVLRLLAKQPRNRLGYARDVLFLLRSSTEEEKMPASASPREYLYRPQLAGREENLKSLISYLELTRCGTGRCVFVGGDSGSGKTRLALAVAREATLRGMRVVTGECTPVTALESTESTRGAPLHPFRRLLLSIADICHEQGRAVAERLVGRRAKILAAHERSLDNLPGLEEQPEPPHLPPQAARQQFFDALRDTISEFAKDRSLVIILDDLQWVDELSLSFLLYLNEVFFESNAVMILGTYRTEEVTDTLREALDRSWIETLHLRPLDDAAIASIIGDMLAMSVPHQRFVDVVASRAAGSPFFVSECLRLAVAEQFIYRMGGTWRLRLEYGGAAVPDAALPESLKELVLRRLSRLSPTSRSIVEVAAILGRETDNPMLLELCGVSVGDATEALREMVALQIFEEVDGNRVRFVHDKVREVAYEELEMERRRTIHAAAARAIEDRYKNTSTFTQLYSTMAHHLRCAGKFDRAVNYLEKAGTLALDSFANREAVRYFRDALELDQRTDVCVDRLRRVRWRRQLATAYIGLGNPEESKKNLLEALAMLDSPMPRTRVRLFIGLLVEVLRQASRLMKMRRPEQVVQSRPVRRGVLETAQVYNQLIPVLTYTAAAPLHLLYATLSAVNVAQHSGSASELALAYIHAHVIVSYIPWFWLAEVYGRCAHEIMTLVPDPSVRSWVYLLSCIYATGAGTWAKAFAFGIKAASIAEEVGFVRRWEEVQGALGIAHFLHGDFETAIETSHLRLSDAATRGDTQTQVWAASGLAQACLNLGEVERALEAAKWAERCIEKRHGRNEQIFGYGILALAYLRTGDRARALEAARKGAVAVKAGRPNAQYCINSYSAILEVLLELWAYGKVEAFVDRQQLEEEVLAMFKAVKRSVRVYRAHRPRYLILLGRYELERGNSRRAVRILWRGLETARRLDMPFDEALAALSLAQTMPLESALRRSLLAGAKALFVRLKAAYDLGRTERELAAQSQSNPRR